MISVYFQGKSSRVTVIQVYAPTTNAEEAEVQWFYEDLQNLLVKVKALVMKLPLTLCDTMDCSPPGSSAHGILQARILEWVAIPFSKASSWPRDQTWFLPHCRKILYHLHHQESPKPSRTNTKKSCPFPHRWLTCKSRYSRDTWSNRQICHWRQNEGGQRLTEFCQENTLVIANTVFQQHKRWLYTWISPECWLYSWQLKMEKLYRVSKNKTGGWLWHRPWNTYCKIQT